MFDRATVQSQYDRGHFLTAYAATSACWHPEVSLSAFDTRDLVLGSRLAARLGGARLARWLCREAYRRDPHLPEVRYFARHLCRNGRDILQVLRSIDAEPELADAEPMVQASWLASNAVTWAVIGDFDRAGQCIDRARALHVRDGWIAACEADVLLRADQWELAAAAAERAWQERPGVPYTARALASTLARLGNFEEAATRLATAAETGESFEVAQTAIWQLCAWAERLTGEQRTAALDRAHALTLRLPSLAPLADRETELAFTHFQLDVASLRNDTGEMSRLAAEIHHPFFRKIAEHRTARPQGRRILLPCHREFQTFNTCLPCSISAALSGLGVNLDWRALAAEFTHEGTAMWAAADWLERRGFSVRFFIVTPDRARALLQAGLPFVLTMDSENSSHAVTAIGLDEASDTLILHDPSLARHSEWLVEGLGDGTAPLGPRGMLIVPADQAALANRLVPDDVHDIAAALHQHQRAHDTKGPLAARDVVDALAKRFPDSPVTKHLRASSLYELGRFGEAMTLLRELMAAHPECLSVRRLLVAASGALGNTALQRSVLADIVDRGLLPGVNATQAWRRPPSTYVCQYADFLRQSAATRPRAIRLLRGVLRAEPANGEAWHILGDALADDTPPAQHELLFRVAVFTARLSEHYARAWCDVVRRLGREEDGLAALERRALRVGTSAIGVAPWITWIDTLEDYGHPERALTAHTDLAARFPEHPERLSWSAAFLARMGRWEEAQATLDRLLSTGHAARGYEASAAMCRIRGAWREGTELAERWLAEVPLSMYARRHLLFFTSQSAGSGEAVARAAAWSAAQPGHDEIELLHYEYLNQDGRSREASALLTARLDRNPEDAWAWRERAFIEVEAYGRLADEEQLSRRSQVEAVLAECERTSLGDPATLRAHALFLEMQGRWDEAATAWREAVQREPQSIYAVNHALDCATRFPAERRRKLIEELEPALLTPAQRMTGARQLLFSIASRYGPALADGCAERWRARRPDDPEVLLAVADLLIDYGHGRSDAARARELLTPAVERFPQHAGLREALGRAQQRTGSVEAAAATLREIVRRHPADTSSRIRLAYMLEKSGDLETARQELATAAEMGRHSTNVWSARVRFQLRQGDRAAALTLLQGGHELFPDHVGWHHTATELLVEAGQVGDAISAARKLVEHRNDNVHAWRLLGELLQQHGDFAQPGEIEAALRRAVKLDVSHFDAADLLAIFLAAQNRREEARAIMRTIARRLADPSPAHGREAWLLRDENPTEARVAMTTTVREAPWYAWGWNQLMTWLEHDKAWDETRDLLREMPPELRHDAYFRRRRLALLARASHDKNQLDLEWKALLADFPEEVPLRLERSDVLVADERLDEARAMVEEARQLAPENPFVLARIVQLTPKAVGDEEFLNLALGVFFARDEGDWPADTVWAAARNRALCGRLADAFLHALQPGKRPCFRAVTLVADEFRGRDPARNNARSPFECWPSGRGFKALQKLLHAVDTASMQAAGPWDASALRGPLFSALEKLGHQHFIARYARRHPDRVRGHVGTWAELGRALLSIHRKAARDHLATWRKQPGVELWMVCNLILTMSTSNANARREVLKECLDALAMLAHDHGARFLAHTAAWQQLILGDREGFLATWTKYRAYLDREERSNEWFPLEAIRDNKTMRQLAPEIEKGGEIPRRKLGLKTFGSFPSPQTGGSSFGYIFGGILLVSLLRACAEAGMHR